MGGSAAPQGTQRQLRLSSSFAVVDVVVFFFLLLFLLFSFVAFVVHVAPFVFDAIVVCAASEVLFFM